MPSAAFPLFFYSKARRSALLSLLLSFLFLTSLSGCGEGRSTALPSSQEEAASFQEERPSLQEENIEADSFLLVTATDLHYLSPELESDEDPLMSLLLQADGKMTHLSEEITEAFLAEVREARPDALLLTGDLTFNGEKKSHEDLAKKLHALEEEGIPVLVLPGNHDLFSDSARSYYGGELAFAEAADEKDFETIYGDFGYREALARDPASLSYLYALSENLWCLCLDVNTKDSFGMVKEETLAFAEECLKKAEEAGVLVIAASHQNLLPHNPIFMDGFVMGRADRLAELYRSYSVAVNLSGHMHVQHIAEENELTDIATSALTVYPCQYGSLTIRQSSQPGMLEETERKEPRQEADPLSNSTLSSLLYRTITLDVEAWAKETGSENPNLLHFSQYAELFFDTITRRGLLAELKNRSLTPEEKERLTEESVRLNRHYIAGRLDLVPELPDILSDWQTLTRDSFWIIYLLSIQPEDGISPDMTRRDLSCPF